MFDSHIHTVNSPDGGQTLDEICLRAIAIGVSGVTITDHAHLTHMEEYDILDRIRASIADVRTAQEVYGDKLQIFCGVELGEQHHAPENAAQVLALTDFDAVLGSIHWVEDCPWDKPYSKIVFDETVSDQQIHDFLALYYADLAKLAEVGQMDILSHLTCPLRYMNQRYKRGIDPMGHRDAIAGILETIIRRDIALEVNTPVTDVYQPIPEPSVLALYRDLGGKLLTLGSDAHRGQAKNVGLFFPEVKSILASLGFKCYHYYKRHIPQPVKL